MAAPLPDEDAPVSSAGPGLSAASDQCGQTTQQMKRTVIDAVATLLESLLTAGDRSSALYITSQCPGLVASRGSVADAWNRAIERCISPLWFVHRYSGVTGQSKKHSLRSRPTDIRYRDSDLAEPRESSHFPQRQFSNSDSNMRARLPADSVTECKTLGALYDSVAPMLRVVGISLYRSPQALLLLCSLIKQSMQLCSERERDATLDLWAQVIRHNLLPAVALMLPNPAIIAQVFALVKEYDQERRFSFYGEWQNSSYKTIPELRVQAVKSERATKDILKRISKTNAKDFGRLLAKSSHTNPCIVLTIALNQIESYDNLVEVVIEASRYFTMLTFDVLSFVLVSLLSADGKEKLKADKTNIAHWLQSLSAFTAKIYKRYSHLDPSPILVLLTKQLLQRSSLDLIILEDLLREMAGVGLSNDLSDEQLEGCTGGATLKSIALCLVNDSQSDSTKSALRLLQALDRSRLTLPLLVLTARQAVAISFVVPDAEAHLKLLSNLTDHVSWSRALQIRSMLTILLQCHQTFVQYLEVLTTFLPIDSFAALIPSAHTLLRQYGLDLVSTFAILRPLVSVAVQVSSPSGAITSLADSMTRPLGRSPPLSTPRPWHGLQVCLASRMKTGTTRYSRSPPRSRRLHSCHRPSPHLFPPSSGRSRYTT